MKLNKEYHQINLPFTRDKYDLSILNGKEVDKVTFAQDSWHSSLNEIIITFTDKTFIAICIEHDEDERAYLDNSYIGEPMTYDNGRLPHQVNGITGFNFDPFVQNRIDCGLWDVTKEEVQELIKEDNKRREEREYKQYLRLKERFENAK